MSVAALLKSTLEKFGDPVFASDAFTTKDAKGNKQYYVFSLSTRGANFADNCPQAEICTATINFFCPHTTPIEARRKQTKEALFAAGFTWPTTVDASDTTGRNIVFECQIETEV